MDISKQLSQYKQVMSPDFSMYTNLSRALLIFNTFRTRWCSFYWQEKRMTVIPTVSWEAESSFEYCFVAEIIPSGIPMRSSKIKAINASQKEVHILLPITSVTGF